MMFEKISHYRILHRLGAGGMGEVYLAEDTLLNRKVAIKLLPADTVADEQAEKRLIKEAQAAAALDHPNICAIHEVGRHGGYSFIVMQYVEGETLAGRMKKSPLEFHEALDIAVQVADGFAEAHSRGIIHRDIKPQNIMITGRGQAKLMDFGLAKATRQKSLAESEAETESLFTEPGMILGTVPYMSPEQVKGEALDARSDIFSFGVVLYEMISGRQPFASESAAATFSAILTRELQPLARYSREAPAELERIVSKALRKDKEDRYQTARDLLIDLRSLRDELQFAARLERSAPPDVSTGKAVATTGAQPVVETAPQPLARTTPGDEKSLRERKTGIPVPALWKTVSSKTSLVIIATSVVVAGAVWFFWHSANVRWAREQVPRIEQLAQAQNYFEAYDLAFEVQKYLSDDATITRLMPTISDTIS